jgi:hypothetical protein
MGTVINWHVCVGRRLPAGMSCGRFVGLNVRCLVLGAFFAVALWGTEAYAQLSDDDIAVLQQRASDERWTFTVGRNGATDRSLDQLCGFRLPDGWWQDAPFDPCTPRDLPTSYDWCALGGCPAVRNQGSCGSCWAFSTVGALECAVKIQDALEVDLSEQWLVSCNQEGWGCDGGYVAHDYHMWKADPCGETGAVFEADFPYAASELPCECPYPHEYFIESWAYIGTPEGVPDVAAIKQAILDHGPVSVGVYVNDAFQAYTGGIFNGCEDSPTNHAVVLVGWDDTQGTNGVWYLRNSWGPGWGEGGYMRIEYGCSVVGEAASYVDYPGYDALDVFPHRRALSTGQPGGPFTPYCQTYTLTNDEQSEISWTAATSADWIDVIPSEGTLAAGGDAEVHVCMNETAAAQTEGVFTDAVTFTHTGTGFARIRPVELWLGSLFDVPADPAQSSVIAQLCVDTVCDSDTSDVSGTTTIQLDDVDVPATISLFDIDLALTDTLDLHLSWSFLGALDCTATDLTIRHMEPGSPLGPVPVTADAFVFEQVPQQMNGTVIYSSWGIPCLALEAAGVPCSGTLDLDGARLYTEQLQGTVTSDNRTVELTTDRDETVLIEGLATFQLTGQVTGETYVPDTTHGDFNRDGVVDLADYAQWSACMTGPQLPGSSWYDEGCQWFDFDFDYDVDVDDFAEMQLGFTVAP